MGVNKRKKNKKDGAENLLNAFNAMCERLELMNSALTKYSDNLSLEQINHVIANAWAIEEEWILDPKQRTPRDGDDYTERFEDG
jgi:hypothetical protein